MSNLVLTNDDILEYSWLDLGDLSKIDLFNPLDFSSQEDIALEFMRMLSNPDYFYTTVKYIFGITLLPFQQVILKNLWTHKFPMLIGSRGLGKSFLLALYILMRLTFTPGCKVVICGSGFRQSKMVFEYMENIWKHAPILRDIAGTQSLPIRRDPDMWTFHIGDSVAYAIPIGNGQKIRGFRANFIIVDEFSSVDVEIYENVISGFAAVKSDPISNVKRVAERKIRERNGIIIEPEKHYDLMGNQSIIGGTAYYGFNHFYQYWRKYCAYIKSKGDPTKLMEMFGSEVAEHFDWRDYCVIRMPFELIPEGFMDEGQVARSRATVHSAIYGMEYGAVFAIDSNGFFKRTLVESCVTKLPIELPSGSVQFHAVTRGMKDKRYVIGIDPASEHDNFSIFVLELWPDHRRIVYGWTTTRQAFKKRIAQKLTTQEDFYGYCVRKVRDLMRVFPCEAIALDTQGGGIAIEEALHDSTKLQEGELKIWPIQIPDKEQSTDNEVGLHILHRISFSSAEWVGSANHNMKKDFEDKLLLFPMIDGLSIELAAMEDAANDRSGDTLEDCVWEIEELKDELSTIVMSQTNAGRDRWDTPEIKLANNKKGRMRKDRYSALLMANMVARTIQMAPIPIPYTAIGGFVGDIDKNISGKLFSGPPDYEQAMKQTQDSYGIVIRRGV